MKKLAFLFIVLFSTIFAQEFIVDENFCRVIRVEANKGVIDRGSLHGIVKEENGYIYTKVENEYDFEFPVAEIDIAEIFPESSTVTFKNVIWPIEEGFLSQVKCKVRKKLTNSIFYKLAKNNIFFISFFDKKPLYDYTYLVQRKDTTTDDSLLSLLIEEAHRSGEIAKEAGFYYIPPSGRFKGIPIDSALTITNQRDIIAFLEFVNDYKNNYAGLDLYFNESYATWIKNDCPEVEQMKAVGEIIKDGENALKTEDYEKAYGIFEQAKMNFKYRDYCEKLNNYIKELLYYQRIAEFDKENIEAHLNVGINLYYIAKELGGNRSDIAHLKYEKVIEIMDYVINKGYPSQIPMRYKGYSLFKLNRIKEALDVFQLILRNYPDDENIKGWKRVSEYLVSKDYKAGDPATYFKLAGILYESEDYDGAIGELKKVVQKGKQDEKEKAIQSIVKIKQENVLREIKSSIERSFKLRNYSVAKKYYIKAESLITKLNEERLEKDFKIFYAEQLANVHRYKEAADKYLDLFSKFNQDEEICIGIFWQFINLGQIDSARYWIEKAVTLNPKSAYAHRVYAHFLIHYTNQIEKGIKEAEKAINLYPKNAWTYYQLAIGYLKKGELEIARANINKAIDLDPDDSDYKNFLANLIQYEKIDSIVRKNGENPKLLFRKGRALYNLCDYQGAIGALTKALKENVTDPEILLYLARSYQALRDYDTAVIIYTKLLEIDPDTNYIYSYSLYSYGMQILQKEPDNPKGYFLLGGYNLLNALYDNAYDYFSIAREKDVEAELDIDIYLSSCREGMKADSFYSRGTNEYNLQDYKSALEFYKSAEELYKKLGSNYDIYRSISQKGACYFMLYDYDNALPNFSQAESLAYKLREPIKKLEAIGAFSELQKRMGNLAGVQEYLKKYKELAEEIDYLYGKANYYLWSAEAYWAFGFYDSARVFYEKASAIYDILRENKQKGECLRSLAAAYELAGEYKSALDLYKEVIKQAHDLKDEKLEMETYLALGQISNTLGDTTNAMDYFKKALQIANILGDIRTKGSILNTIGFNYYYLIIKNYDQALTYFEKVREIGEFLPDLTLQTVAYANIGLCYARKKDFEKAIRYQTKATNLAKEVKDLYLEVQGYGEISETYYDMADYKRALEYTRKAIYLAEKMNLLEFLWNYYYSAGKIFEAKGEIDSAIYYYTGSKEIIKRLKAGLTEEAKELYMKGLNREDVFKRLAALLLKKGKSEEAFKVLEESKILSLKENLQGIAPQTQDENLNILLKNYQEQERKIDKVEKMIQEEKQLEKANQYKIDNLSKLLAQTQGEFNNVTGELRDKYYMVYGLMSVQPVELSDIRDTLPPYTAILEYFVTDSVLYIFFASKQSIAVREINITRELLYKKVEYFIGAIKSKSDTDAIKESGNDLYRYLIKPFEEALGDYQELIIIPYGYLHYLPFSALVSDDNRYLIEDYQISYINSATFIDIVRRLLATKALSNFSLLAVVDPDGSLPGARNEGKILQEELFPQNKVLIFKDANRNNFLKEAQGYRIIHLATHGFLDNKDPSASFIVMNGGEEADKFTIREIRNVMCDLLKQNDLIFLSACKSAVEPGNVSVGRELTTLAEAFTMAGSPSLIAGLWEIADEASVKLVKEFYSRLKKGEAKSKSLKEAQIILLNSSEFSHPFFWAPFVLIGDWR
ncbi:MAG: CHAT domain-containing protein [candidate division WOR-3 bacterium]